MKKNAFILVLGETNSGKSTLINQIVGDKVSIVSHKVQTTRFRVLGILTKGDNQLVFIDTPGIFKPKREFDKQMLSSSFSEISSANIIILLMDVNKGITEHTHNIINNLPKNVKVICALNKVDLIQKEKLLELSKNISELYDFNKFFMISALKNQGINSILDYINESEMQEGWHFDEDQISDLPINQLATEITREQIYYFLHQELPYNIFVQHLSWEENATTIKIYQDIFITKKNYKAIILGKNGEKIKQIRLKAQEEMKKLFGKNVFLYLYIKICKDMSNANHNKGI